jgi:hypothetical protein
MPNILTSDDTYHILDRIKYYLPKGIKNDK